MRKLETTIFSSANTAIRNVIVSGRCCEKRELIVNPSNGGMTGAVSFVFKGDHTVCGGHGEIFDRYCETGVFSGYRGQGKRPVVSSEDNYNEAPMRLIKLNETYKKLRYDVDRSKLNIYYITFYVHDVCIGKEIILCHF